MHAHRRATHSPHWITYALALFIALVPVQRAVACVKDPPQPPVVQIIFHSTTDVWLCFQGYQTFGSLAGASCACAFDFNASANINDVVAVQVVLAGTGQELPGWGTWSRATGLDDDFDALSGNALPDYRAFSATTTADIDGDVSVDIYVRVTVNSGTTFASLATELLGRTDLLGTGGHTAGVLDHHETVQPVLGAELPLPWRGLGEALAGTGGKLPRLLGEGPVTDDSPFFLTLDNARPLARTFLVWGLSQLSAPFKGGVMVPFPTFITDLGFTDATGGIAVGATWPTPGFPGIALYWQYWIQDLAGPVSYAASNALTCTTQSAPVVSIDMGGISPTSGLAEGDLLTINGTGFGYNPHDLCILVDDITLIPRSVSPTQIIAEIGPVPQAVTGGTLTLASGQGIALQPTQIPAACEVFAAQEGRTWSHVPNTSASSGGQSIDIETTSSDSVAFVYDGGDERLEADMDAVASWDNGDEVRIDFHTDVEDSGGGGGLCDWSRTFTLVTGGNPNPSLDECGACLAAIINDNLCHTCAARIEASFDAFLNELYISAKSGSDYTVVAGSGSMKVFTPKIR